MIIVYRFNISIGLFTLQCNLPQWAFLPKESRC